MIRLRTIGILAVLLALAGAGFAWHQWTALDAPLTTDTQPIPFEVERGSSLRQIIAALHHRGWVRSPWALELYARRANLGRKMRAGHYLVDPKWTPKMLLHALEKGVLPPRVRLTFAEGLNRWEMAKALEDAGLCESAEFLRIVEERDLEGRLFPDTYWFRKDASLEEVLETFAHRFQRALMGTYGAWAPASKARKRVGSEGDFLILASLVEKEAKKPADQRKVARVFFNRLRQGMKLQTDPTCVYGPKLHTQKPHPRNCRDPSSTYSTYVINGLPPSPIANPGESAMTAVLKPYDGPGAERLLYFVARRDGSGEHHFSTSLAEHRRAIDRYLKKKAPSP